MAEAQKSTAIEDQIHAIQAEALRQLQVLNEQLYRLFVSNNAVQEALHLPIPVTIQGSAATRPVAQQHGGVVSAQTGRLVGVMAEPGEVVFPGPLSSRAVAAAEALNRQYPRFQVGGHGNGKTVPRCEYSLEGGRGRWSVGAVGCRVGPRSAGAG